MSLLVRRNEGKVVLLTNLRVVLTECGSDVYDTGTVGHGYVVVAYDVMSLSLLSFNFLCGEVEEGHVLASFELCTIHLCEDLVSLLAFFLSKGREHLIEECLSHIVGVAVSGSNLAVSVLGVNAKCYVGGKSPGGGGPSEVVCILISTLEASDSGLFLNGLISLSYLVAGKRPGRS